MAVTWKVKLNDADAEKVNDEIHSIIASNGNDSCTPQELVDFARNNPNSESYKCFDWNDSTAAEKWRCRQARSIMQNLIEVTIVESEDKEKDVEPKQVEVKLFYGTGEEKKYVPTEVLVTKKDQYQLTLEMAYRELQQFKARYKHLKELANIIALIP